MTLSEALGIDRSDPEAELARRLANADLDLIEDLVRIREDAGLKQTQVAEIMGVSPSAVSRIESGARDPHMSTLRRYAFAIGADVSHFACRFDAAAWRAKNAARHVPDSARSWDWADPTEFGRSATKAPVVRT